MTRRIALVTFATVLAAIGCHKPPATKAIPGAGPAATPATSPVPITDYRTLKPAELEILISDKSGNPVKGLTSVGPNQYTGSRMSPDGTAQLQVAVTVEKERIIIETRGGGLSAKEYITPRGYEAGNPR